MTSAGLWSVLAAFAQGEPAPALDPRVTWTPLAPARATAISGASIAPLLDGSLLVSGPSTATDTYSLEFEALPKGVTAFRVEALPDDSLPAKGPGRAPSGNFVLSELRVSVGPRGTKRPRAVGLQNVTASFAQDGFPANAAIDGVGSKGWAIHPQQGAANDLIAETKSDLQVETNVVTLELAFDFGGQHTLGRFRISATTAPRPVRETRKSEPGAWGEVQGRINRAIDMGCEWLLAQQLLDGSWDVDEASYRNGGTALVTYALLKSGVKSGHPAIQRALEFMKAVNPTQTYTLGCQLMALAALDDPAVEPWIKQLGEQLLQYQQPNGGFNYGATGGGIDLSNSQYGALGLRAAAQRGLKVPPEVWDKLAQFAIAHGEEGSGGGYAPLGFRYDLNNRATGSMTAAGAGILAICDEHLRGRTKAGNLLGLAKRGGEWLGVHFAADTNPRGDIQWVYYFLYGVERLGALLRQESMGGHLWYREGAKFLVDHQDEDGKWSHAGNNPLCNTSWSLLFLTRATSIASGQAAPRSKRTWGGDDSKAAVSIRASGDTPLTFWISSFGDLVIEEYEWPADKGRGLRVKRVEWFASGMAGGGEEESIAIIEKDGAQPCGRERFSGQYSFPLPGKYSISVRVHLIAPPALPGGPGGEVEIESPLLQVKVDETSDPELLRYAGDAARNLLLGQRPVVTPSSTINDWWAPRYLSDGLLVRGWASADNDPKPRISIELEKPVRANLLQVTLAKVSDDRPGRITKLNVTLNGKGPPLELAIDPSPIRKSKLRFGQAVVVRRIDLEVTEVFGVEATVMKSVGIAEVELQVEGGARK